MDYVSFSTVKSISFATYTNEEIKKFSALEITNTEILDCLGHPSPGGLYDLHLGPNEKDDFCETCTLNFFKCPGHPGHITLPVPVFNPIFFPYLYQLLRGSCFHCHRLVAPEYQLHLALYQLQALDYGMVSTVQELAAVLTDTEEVAVDSDFATVIQHRLKQKFEEAIKGLTVNDTKKQVKSVVECRRNIVKNFVKNYMMRITGKCPHCKMPRKPISRHNMRLIHEGSKRSIQPGTLAFKNSRDAETQLSLESGNKELLPDDARNHLLLLWEKDKIFLQNLFKVLCESENRHEIPVNMFFIDLLFVPPSRFRRLNILKDKKYADSQTLMFSEVLKDSYLIRNLQKLVKQMQIDETEKDMINKLPGKTNGDKYHVLYQRLQKHVNEIFDSDTNKENKFTTGIKQILEKKEGLFRMHMMGKRVNYAARSVISPDPYIMVNEIGVPLVFAKKLTFPEPVSIWNVEKLRLAVRNGPNVHPGAALVEYEDGKIVKLSADDPTQRYGIASTLLTPQASAGHNKISGVKIVHRHLKNGDNVLVNRQPTLHKPSIMAHKVRVLPGEKTLRLHYANCKSYNADFDGDEMNIHFPQSYLSQSECRHIVNVNHQYLVPKDGTPLSGLIQDHIIAGTLLTMRGRFFTEDQYHQLLYNALSFSPKKLKILPPSILKPEKLWSGKQIVSSVIINLVPESKVPPTIEGKAKISSKNWKNSPVREWNAGGTPLQGDKMSESEIIIRSGELLCGVIDKAQVGPTPYSLIHVCYELYGGETSTIMLTALARLFTHYLQNYHGFSLGTEDIIVNKKANKQRKRILKKAAKNGLKATAKALDVENVEKPDEKELLKKFKDVHFCRDDFGLKMLDVEMKKVTQDLNNDIKDVCIPDGLIKKFPANSLQLMIESGAKGSTVNAMQISCLLGQIELEGRRMPLMLNGSSLPSFLPYDTSPESGGFVAGRFLTGVNIKEYFFHCMAGREGLIDTAVKTSRSGYLQRCLIKHLEGITVNYDLTVRDSDGTVIQFLYGEDGLDISKSQMLKENRLHLLAQNYDAAINENNVKALQNFAEADLPKLQKWKKKIERWNKKHSNRDNEPRSSLIKNVPVSDISIKQRIQLLNVTKCEMDENILKKYKKEQRKPPSTAIAQYRPDLVFSSVSEKLDQIISDYRDNSLNKHLSYSVKSENALSSNKFENLCYYQAQKSLAEPGETVGLLAAQSIGEPSTQMTLNTFHFAGKGEMNVTLGIPRIREILMTASANIATPTMDLPLLDKPGIEEKAERLRLKLNPVHLKEILEDIQIKEFLSINENMMNCRNYVIRFNFLKLSEYKGFLNTTPSKILHYMEKIFVKKLIDAIKRKRQKFSKSPLIIDFVREATSNFSRATKVEEEEADAAVPPTEQPQADDGDSSGAESDGDGDASSARSRIRHNQELEYEDPEEEEVIPESDGVSEHGDVEIKQEIPSSEEETKDNFVFPDMFQKLKKISISDHDKACRINVVKCINSWIANYDFDEVKARWCEISLQIDLSGHKIDMKSLLEDEVDKALVHAIPDIKEALLVKNPDSNASGMMIKTNGVNFLEVFKHVDILDINKAYSNNIHSIAGIYGIEAAARAIKKEIVNVFKPYGIEVDPRHLSLISDYMTSSGYYRPCNRIGMEGNASPLQQMTFETTKNFLVEAMLMGFEDKLLSPSANIVLGQLSPAGTGCFALRCASKRKTMNTHKKFS